MRMQPKKLIIAALAVILATLVGVFAVSALRQPDSNDYKRLDSQRKIVDLSMNAYNPLLETFSADYQNVFSEGRPSEEITSLRKDYFDSFERDRDINRARLKTMESSIALRDPVLKRSFENYQQRYGAVVNYYDQYSLDIASINESIAGPCAKLSQMNVSVSTFAADYTKAADICLSALGSSKSSSSPAAKQLLTGVETLVKKRRDAFKSSAEKEGFDQKISNFTALLTLLDINTEVKDIQLRYETEVKTDYTKLVNEANGSNETFKQALKKYVTDDTKGSEA